MAELHTLARPYARAVFELAHEGGALPQWSAALAALKVAVSDPKVEALLSDPRLARSDAAAALIAGLGGALDAQGANFVKLLAENKRLELLPAIAAEYETLRADAESRVDVEITTAADVAEAQRQALHGAISKRLARQVGMSWKTDPALIAGAVIRAGDLVIDGSVAGELTQLRQALNA